MITEVGRVRRLLVGASLGALMGAVLATIPASASQGASHDQVVDSVPGSNSPAVLNGSVRTIEKVGDTVILGGNFSRARSAGGGAELTRNNILTFDSETGQIDSSFAPSINGMVEDVAPGPKPGTIYVAGRFSNVNGTGTTKVVVLNLSDGSRDTSFDAPSLNGRVEAIARSGNRLYVGGSFRNAGGDFFGGLVAVNATTGERLPYLNLPVTQRHNDTGGGAQGAIGVRGLVVTPDGSRMVIIGNFKRVDGEDRDQAAVIDLGANEATLSSWHTRRYEPYCFNWAYDTYMRGVAMSPDGSYFVITTTGGHNDGTLCDTASRFETDAAGEDIQPTWISDTGGDSLWGVDITGEAIYVGGHQRWMNNALGSDRPRPGAVPRPGLAALDPKTGVPIEWNPGRNPRGAFVYDINATDGGLWLGSNTEWIGNRDYRRQRIAFFPVAGGEPVADDSKPGLPGNVYIGTSADSGSLNAVEFDGSTAGELTPVDDEGVAWNRVNGAFRAGNYLFYGRNDGALYRRTYQNGNLGQATRLDPYHDPRWANVATGSGQTYDGATSAFYGQIPNVTGMYYDDGRLFYTLQGQSSLYYRYFSVDSGIVGVDEFEAPTGRNWSQTSGMFEANGKVYVASSANGALTSIDVEEGIPSGSSSVVDDTVDWQGNALFVGGAVIPPNEAPTASFTTNCDALTCTFDASDSTDDGSIVSYEWDFGDETTGTGKTSQHTYDSPGSYHVSLTVTDNNNATDTTSSSVQPADPSDSSIEFRAATAVNPRRANPSFDVPTSVQAGDTLVVIASFGSPDPAPTAPSGWTLVANREVYNSLHSAIWTRTATAADAGRTYTWDVSGAPKSTFTVAAYDGVDNDNPIRAFAVDSNRHSTSHTSPTANAVAGDWALSYWTDRTSGTTSWTPPSGVAARADAYGNGGGRVTSLLADSGWPVATGEVGGLTATTDVSSSRALSWTIVLRAAEGTDSGDSPGQPDPPASSIEFGAATAVHQRRQEPRIEVPADIQAGNTLVAIGAFGSADPRPVAPSGWTKVAEEEVADQLESIVWTRTATAADAGRTYAWQVSGAPKVTLTLAAYDGVDGADPIRAIASARNRHSTSHESPTATAADGDWVLSYWTDRTSGTTSWTPPSGVAPRAETYGNGGGRITSLLADSDGPMPAGDVGGLTATTNVSSSRAISWTIVLRSS